MMNSPTPPMKGRGTSENPPPRFHDCVVVPDISEETPLAIATTYSSQLAKSIIATNRSPDVPFTQSINPYQGCEHGCIYCFARPTHAYWDLSPGLDFESHILWKENAAHLLREELSKKSYQCKPIALGSNTDPYQPAEKNFRITRSILEVLQEFHHPFTIVTKSSLILRDLDILSDMALKQLCSVHISVTTLDNELKRKLEPRTASPAARLSTLQALAQSGIPSGVLVAPIIPKINDHELEHILAEAQSHGASTAGYIFIRLPHEVAPLFQSWLQTHYPLKATHVMSLIKQSRQGKAYNAQFDTRMAGTGPFADLLAHRFALACKRLGLNKQKNPKLNTALFSPCHGATAPQQLSLF